MSRPSVAFLLLTAGLAGSACGRSTHEDADGTGAMSGNSGAAAEPEGGAGGASAGVGATGGQATAGEGAGGIAGSSAGAGATGGAMAGSSASLGPEGCVLYTSKGCPSAAVGFECPPDIYYAPPDGCSDCDDPNMPNHNCPIDGASGVGCTLCCCVPTRGGCEKRSGTCVAHPTTPNVYMCLPPYDPPAPGCVVNGTLAGIDALCCP